MSRLPLPENPVLDHDVGKDAPEEEHVVSVVESSSGREEPVVTRRVSNRLTLTRVI